MSNRTGVKIMGRAIGYAATAAAIIWAVAGFDTLVDSPTSMIIVFAAGCVGAGTKYARD
jgi:hypothetical protein